MINLDGKVAIVTGAGAGLGRQHALQLAARGARVVVNDVAVGVAATDQPGAETVVAEINAAGGTAVADVGSVADAESARQLVTDAVDAFGQVDIVVNNAGIVRDAAFHKMDAQQFDDVLGVHLEGTLNVTQAAWAGMRERGFGRVICTTSAVGLLGNFGQANYGAAKAGIVGLVKNLAIEGRKYGIRANAIAPIAETQMTDGLLGHLTGRVPPELVAPLTVWLASAECTETGNVYSVGGGRIARFYVGMTPGWARTDGELSPEDIAEHWDQINSTDGAVEARALKDDFKALLVALDGERR